MVDIEKPDTRKLTESDMTVNDLQALVERIVEQKLMRYSSYKLSDGRSPAEVLASTRKNRIQPEPGMPSALELLREERDQWYKPT